MKVCKACGAEFEIGFFCPMCGEKVSPDERDIAVPAVEKAQAVPAPLPEDRNFVEAHLIDAVTQHENYFKYFNRKDYEEHFFQFKRDISPVFAAMERYTQAVSDQREQVLTDFVCRFLDDREAYHRQSKAWPWKKSTLLFESKLILALYLVPAVLDLKLSVSEDFVRLLREENERRYPDGDFVPATFEEISTGFTGRKLCFITTAVCEFEGKPDDCAELQCFRGFRDGWLSGTAEGKALIEEYYAIAPSIVRMIDLCDDRAAVYGRLREQYLSPCFDSIKAQNYSACRERYVQMVRDLQCRYGLA